MSKLLVILLIVLSTGTAQAYSSSGSSRSYSSPSRSYSSPSRSYSVPVRTYTPPVTNTYSSPTRTYNDSKSITPPVVKVTETKTVPPAPVQTSAPVVQSSSGSSFFPSWLLFWLMTSPSHSTASTTPPANVPLSESSQKKLCDLPEFTKLPKCVELKNK